MDKLLEKLLESISDGNILLVPLIIAIGLFLNGKKIIDFWEERLRARVVKITEALKSGLVVGKTKSHLESELVKEHFKLITGINIEEEFREALLKVHSKCNGEIKFLHFKRALPHLKFKNSTISVNITSWAKVVGVANLVGGLFLVAYGLVLLFLVGQIPESTFLKVFYVLSMSIVCFIFGLYFGSLSSSVYSAKQIAPYVERAEKDSAVKIEVKENS